MKADSLGDRMKAYESSSRMTLPKRLPVIIRVDGRAFHTYTRGLKKPFDKALQSVMNDVAVALCEEVQGAQFAYVQSDEVSVFVHNYKKLTTSAWFDNNVQKIVSISAALASTTFTMNSWKLFSSDEEKTYKRALFDSRVFVVPENEVSNYFVWRQNDAIRNSIQMLARATFSHKQCDNKTTKNLLEMLADSGIDWNDLPISDQRGRTIVKGQYSVCVGEEQVERSLWITNFDTPIFSKNPGFVNEFLAIEP